MSDDPREAQQKMKRVFLCDDIWWDCLPFLSRPKIGLAFALVSDRFDRLADRYLNSKGRPWKLGKLWINNAIIVKKCLTETEKHLPLPDGPLPDNVIGFECISIFYVDHKVIDFLRRIRRLFQPTNNGNDGIGLKLDIDTLQEPNVRSLDVFFDSIWPLINPSAITRLDFQYSDTFDVFRQRSSPTVLFDLANLRVVNFCFQTWFDYGENGQLLSKWLHSPRKDGKPKLLKNYLAENLQTVEQLKTKFLGAQTAVSFIIGMCCSADDQQPVPFELDNWRTGERLALRLYFDSGFGERLWLLERGPIGGRDAKQWAKWEREASDMIMDPEQAHNLLKIWLDDYDIGGRDAEQWAKWEDEAMDTGMDNLLTMKFGDDDIGLLDETAGPSEQTIAEK